MACAWASVRVRWLTAVAGVERRLVLVKARHGGGWFGGVKRRNDARAVPGDVPPGFGKYSKQHGWERGVGGGGWAVVEGQTANREK